MSCEEDHVQDMREREWMFLRGVMKADEASRF